MASKHLHFGRDIYIFRHYSCPVETLDSKLKHGFHNEENNNLGKTSFSIIMIVPINFPGPIFVPTANPDLSMDACLAGRI